MKISFKSDLLENLPIMVDKILFIFLNVSSFND